MCTAISLKMKEHYFGRNLDIEYSYGESVIITPRKYPFYFRRAGEIMNHYARSIGILDSHFESPHGLDSSKHYSSAYDLAILTCKGLDYDLFREVVGSKSIAKEKYNFTRDYNNINKILWLIPEANGVKTGYTGGAGKCLVSSMRNNNKDIIIVVLNCPDRWKVTEKIYNHVKEAVAFENISMKELV